MRRKDDEKKQSIKEAVIKLILKEGFHGTSISKIAKEAGVSPATVYIYYENKEVMLQDIYREYSEDVFYYLLDKLNNCNKGEKIIEVLVREYYLYINDNNEIFHFVDQFASCPALANQCSARNGISILNNLFDEMKKRGVFKDFENDNLRAILFYPTKSIVMNSCIDNDKKIELLNELIEIIQDAILIK
ncbi:MULTISPECIES: TetR/AcrR family transcriptional regulator [Clostridium]|uniref:TetR/AcrR family transcriptional regulator n=1 Tax=Clostridium cibarium TaxID=2762247 RepID=A0ABR8PSQ2_9CLOT|nr:MULTISPECIES: TetR/AcrR family transcriptional regulator [Clostridium]MBD7911194.1 TetR/AcrR family transcriptional regulator [Clostridium cibarium]